MEIDAFILIGGRSSRFGSDKARAEFDGKTLAEHAAETVRTAISPTRITLVAANDTQFLGADFLAGNIPVILDLFEGRGPAGGLHAAAAYAQTEWILLLACDLPLVSAGLIRHLSGLISKDVDAVVPVQPDGRAQPLAALYCVKPTITVLSEILEKARPAPSMTGILERVRTRFVPFEEMAGLANSTDLFANANTPEELKSAEEVRNVRR